MRNPMLPVFDPALPIVVAQRFRNGSRTHLPNEVFDGSDKPEAVLRDLANAGYIRNGTPQVRELDQAVVEKRKAEFEVSVSAAALEKARKAVKEADRKAGSARARRVSAALRQM